MTTSIISKLAPKNSGAFPTHSDIHTEGGFQVRADTTDRDNIPTLNRKEGMWVKVQSDGKVYTLSGGITNGDWTEVSFSAGAAVIFDAGTTSENIRSNRATLSSPIDNTKDGIVNLGTATTFTSGATGNYSTISGGENNNANGDHSTVGGGSANTAGGINNTISGGINNTTSGDTGTIAGGNGNTSANNFIFIGGGQNNSASADYCTIGGGQNNSAGGINATVGGGLGNFANGAYSTVPGGISNTAGVGASIAEGYYAATDKYGQYAHSSSNMDASPGNSQYTRVVYMGESVSGASVSLTAGDATEYQLVPNKNYAMKITVVAGQSAGSAPAIFVYDLLVAVNASNVATILATNLNYSYNPTAYTVILSIFSSNILRLDFSGIGGVTVRAVATFEATELSYA